MLENRRSQGGDFFDSHCLTQTNNRCGFEAVTSEDVSVAYGV